MRGFKKGWLAAFFILVVSVKLGAQVQKQTLYVDHNYRAVSKERDAAFTVYVWETGDTVRFESYSISPRIKSEEGYYPKGEGYDLRNCQLKRFWPNGNLRSKGELKHSWNEGIWEYFDEEGTIYSEVAYKDGVIHGDAKRYYKNGLAKTFTYVKNIREGESIYFDSTGRIYAVCNYHNDSLHGICIEYFETGIIKRKANYQYGVLSTDTQYYENGNVFNCESYDSKGLVHGRCMMLLPSGKIARYDEYSHGDLLQNNCVHPLADADYEGDDCPERLREANYPGGKEKFNEFINANQDYPEEAMKWKQQGLVVMDIHINKYGAIVEVTPENIIPMGFGLEKECERLLGMLKKFEPKQLNGKYIPSHMSIPFVFIL
ncbi:MAG: energy transducer TonB [Bacteroidia bacterium]|nr:energy transducer TonB [Bacteroidia bacterium]